MKGGINNVSVHRKRIKLTKKTRTWIALMRSIDEPDFIFNFYYYSRTKKEAKQQAIDDQRVKLKFLKIRKAKGRERVRECEEFFDKIERWD